MNSYVFRRPGSGQLITIKANSIHEARNKMKNQYGNAYYAVQPKPVTDSRRNVTTDENGEPTPY